MRKAIRFIVLVLVLMLVALGSALTAMRFAIHGREILVPRLIGMGPHEAERVAADNGLLLSVESRFYSNTVPEGKILSQLPPPGTRVRRGWRLRVAESLGPQRITIPNLMGQSARAADINIRRRGLDVGTVATTPIPDALAEQVVAQSPAPNADIITSPKISLLVAQAPEPAAFVMPNFVGKNLSEAASEIGRAGLRLGKVTPAAVEPAPVPGAENAVNTVSQQRPSNSLPGVILKQSPAPGQKVTAAMAITFEVSR